MFRRCCADAIGEGRWGKNQDTFDTVSAGDHHAVIRHHHIIVAFALNGAIPVVLQFTLRLAFTLSIVVSNAVIVGDVAQISDENNDWRCVPDADRNSNGANADNDSYRSNYRLEVPVPV